MQNRVPAERDGSSSDKDDLIWLHGGTPLMLLSSRVQPPRIAGQPAKAQEPAGCGGAFQRACGLSATACAGQLGKLGGDRRCASSPGLITRGES